MHLGVRSNSMEWLEIQKDFYENEFIPNLKKNVKPGDILVQVGDAFDNRQSINLKVLHYAVDLFERLGEILPVHVICGNHDIWAKKSNEITSIDSLKWIPNVAIYKEPRQFNWADKKVLRHAFDAGHQGFGHDEPAEPPASHVEVLAKTVATKTYQAVSMAPATMAIMKRP